MANSIIRPFDLLAFTSSPTAVAQTGSLYFQRQRHSHGIVQVDVSDSSLLLGGGDLFIIGRPNTDADFVTLQSVAASTLNDTNGYMDIPLMHEMRILITNLTFSAPVTISSWILGD